MRKFIERKRSSVITQCQKRAVFLIFYINVLEEI